ncbi:hypothetical protein [Marinifilum caeruleilacunae]|uniref:DUF973 family protein n=1 Tax=Marinifilum caeruleilacunae TaxID=2499076 RepID=A0ABX1WXB0_9BACT|nr:hypothetical protein [Marinifilum caeruleilacunae]NOU60749.1 hypothetical protein [Marinifilum caeruleilacunae]
MNQQKYIEDLNEIKEMMNKSSKFISLSGLSGIAAGVVALAGAYVAWITIYSKTGYQNFDRALLSWDQLIQLIGIGAITLLLAVGLGIFFTRLKTKRSKQNIWDSQTKRLLMNLLIPLLSGGAFCLLILIKGYVGLIAPLTLLFYGLALVNASKYTLTEVRSLGILEIILGLIATYFIGYGLIFWCIGFGVLHIVYGIIMEVKYKS